MIFCTRSFRLLRNIKINRKYQCYSDIKRATSITEKLKTGPDLKDFITGTSEPILTDRPHIPYLPDNIEFATKRKVFFDVYGCQMNLNDTEIVWSILKKDGFEKTEVEEEADIFLVMTCAIREGAENKIWNRLDHLRGFKRRAMAKNKNRAVKIGILGCMAERLKEKLIEKEKAVDVVAGPDSYRDLPRLLALTESGQTAVNVLLSLDETYADVVPVRLNQDSVSAFISIMRGCDNMCTYCIVPFTRGRERSRPSRSIVDEVREMADRGVKEITLLGQNVNSYRDIGEEGTHTQLVDGFKTVYKPKRGGLRFAELLDRVSAAAPEVRVRFTAAHPKDFPDEVLHMVNSRPNICKMLHLPAQSGSSAVLARMRRGHSREAYLRLVRRARDVIPGVGLSTDMICGFCGETDEEFEETLTLMDEVGYNVAFLFSYSMREKTTAYRRYQDDVPDHVKRQRHDRMIALYRRRCQEIHRGEVGTTHLVLVEGIVQKTGQLVGRNELYIKVVFDQTDVPVSFVGYDNFKAHGLDMRDARTIDQYTNVDLTGGNWDYLGQTNKVDREDRVEMNGFDGVLGERRRVEKGDYVAVRIVGGKASVLSGVPLYHTTLTEFYRVRGWGDRKVAIS